jgi:hypothetical protein
VRECICIQANGQRLFYRIYDSYKLPKKQDNAKEKKYDARMRFTERYLGYPTSWLCRILTSGSHSLRKALLMGVGRIERLASG